MSNLNHQLDMGMLDAEDCIVYLDHSNSASPRKRSGRSLIEDQGAAEVYRSTGVVPAGKSGSVHVDLAYAHADASRIGLQYAGMLEGGSKKPRFMGSTHPGTTQGVNSRKACSPRTPPAPTAASLWPNMSDAQGQARPTSLMLDCGCTHSRLQLLNSVQDCGRDLCASNSHMQRTRDHASPQQQGCQHASKVVLDQKLQVPKAGVDSWLHHLGCRTCGTLLSYSDLIKLSATQEIQSLSAAIHRAAACFASIGDLPQLNPIKDHGNNAISVNGMTSGITAAAPPAVDVMDLTAEEDLCENPVAMVVDLTDDTEALPTFVPRHKNASRDHQVALGLAHWDSCCKLSGFLTTLHRLLAGLPLQFEPQPVDLFGGITSATAAETAARPPSPPPLRDGWTCQKCTKQNDSGAARCFLCHKPCPAFSPSAATQRTTKMLSSPALHTHSSSALPATEASFPKNTHQGMGMSSVLPAVSTDHIKSATSNSPEKSTGNVLGTLETCLKDLPMSDVVNAASPATTLENPASMEPAPLVVKHLLPPQAPAIHRFKRRSTEVSPPPTIPAHLFPTSTNLATDGPPWNPSQVQNCAPVQAPISSTSMLVSGVLDSARSPNPSLPLLPHNSVIANSQSPRPKPPPRDSKPRRCNSPSCPVSALTALRIFPHLPHMSKPPRGWLAQPSPPPASGVLTDTAAVIMPQAIITGNQKFSEIAMKDRPLRNLVELLNEPDSFPHSKQQGKVVLRLWENGELKQPFSSLQSGPSKKQTEEARILKWHQEKPKRATDRKVKSALAKQQASDDRQALFALKIKEIQEMLEEDAAKVPTGGNDKKGNLGSSGPVKLSSLIANQNHQPPGNLSMAVVGALPGPKGLFTPSLNLPVAAALVSGMQLPIDEINRISKLEDLKAALEAHKALPYLPAPGAGVGRLKVSPLKKLIYSKGVGFGGGSTSNVVRGGAASVHLPATAAARVRQQLLVDEQALSVLQFVRQMLSQQGSQVVGGSMTTWAAPAGAPALSVLVVPVIRNSGLAYCLRLLLQHVSLPGASLLNRAFLLGRLYYVLLFLMLDIRILQSMFPWYYACTQVH